MDSSDLSVLVGRLERQSDADPRWYIVKVAMVAALGYAPVVLLGLAILTSCYFVIASLLAEGQPGGWALLACTASVAALVALVRMLWVQIGVPAGREISREEAPPLFAALEDMLEKMAAHKPTGEQKKVIASIDSVALDCEFNVSLRQIPRWGVFGQYRNHLQVGIPMLTALSIAEFKAMLAHEIGHLGGEGDRFQAWIYRQRGAWRALQAKLDEPLNVFDRIAALFYGWYTPYLYAYTSVLARHHEYQADRLAAKATNIRLLARALTKTELMARFLSEVFWKRLFDQVEKIPEPRYLPYAMMRRAFDVAQNEWLRKDWLHSSLHAFATTDDTHPSLGERLAALEVLAELPSHSPDASALSLLGDSHATLLKWCDDEWSRENIPVWRARHNAIKEIRWKIAQYDNTPPEELKAEDLWQKSALLLDLGQDHDAMETLSELLARQDAPAEAHLLMGKLLLAYADERGLEHLKLASQQDPELIDAAGQVGYGYLMDRGRKSEAHRFWNRIRVE